MRTAREILHAVVMVIIGVGIYINVRNGNLGFAAYGGLAVAVLAILRPLVERATQRREEDIVIAHEKQMERTDGWG